MSQSRPPQQDRALPISSVSSSLLGQTWDSWALRVALLGASAFLCYSLAPFGFHGLPAAGLGFFVAMVVLLGELRLRHAEISGLLGGALGGVFGLLAALLLTLVLSRTPQSDSTKSFLEFTALLAFPYLGLMLGSRMRLAPPQISPLQRAEIASPAPNSSLKLLDTSVLIDGRIADICETHFLDGALGVPRFVLHEVQLVADSSDNLKRQRGRRGLEVLQRMQKMPCLDVRILEEDISGVSAVDQKLVDLARQLNAKIVTNDFNLNKVARVQGLAVLNINELANALKPAVLPGESMRVLVLREGKEPTQGVAYLDDGTMVVVDGARRLINRTIDILVTSIHQTPAGKMIFGRIDERTDSAPQTRSAAASGNGTARTEPSLSSAAAGPGNGHSRTDGRQHFDHSPSALYSDNNPS